MVAPVDKHHDACLAIVRGAEPPLVSTWPCFTEAMFIADRDLGWAGQDALWRMVDRGALLLMDLDADGRSRAAQLMRKYRDLPMALADATLVAVAETLDISTVFTLDRDFEVYRLNGRKPFRILP